ncbi:Pantothenic acid ECF transporter S component PanT [Listeria grayi]|uniref:Pantothenic acid ECF transporter S component PanT n=1 Tax=Listeria grayi TaxID=1641 RepID=A0A378MGX1_LISGR|nr:ECF transporter S component [Listeria grayi]STY44746.1 Pantothenic acid ECF transporter S component PanT [Listeria grayi]
MSKSKDITLLAVFTGIILLLAFTPLGFIPLGIIKATIIHIPVIIGSILLGPKRGAILGVVFGATSLISNTISPALLSFVFSPFIPIPGLTHGSLLALLICFLPRLLVGILPFYFYRFFARLFKSRKPSVSYLLAGIAGSLINTVLVMAGIYFFFGNAYAEVQNIPIKEVYGAIISIIAINGVPEAIVAGLITMVVLKIVNNSNRFKQLFR